MMRLLISSRQKVHTQPDCRDRVVVYRVCRELRLAQRWPPIAVLRNKQYLVGLTAGSLWLILLGSAFAVWALITVKSPLAIFLSAGTAVLALSLIFFGIFTIRGALRQPDAGDTEPSQARRIRLQFGLTFAAESLGCAVVSIASIATHHWRFIVPLNLIIVGLHFLPLARLFAVPRYYVLGALFCLIPIMTMLFIPDSGHIGRALSWIFIPAAVCGLAALLTGWMGLGEVRRTLST